MFQGKQAYIIYFLVNWSQHFGCFSWSPINCQTRLDCSREKINGSDKAWTDPPKYYIIFLMIYIVRQVNTLNGINNWVGWNANLCLVIFLFSLEESYIYNLRRKIKCLKILRLFVMIHRCKCNCWCNWGEHLNDPKNIKNLVSNWPPKQGRSNGKKMTYLFARKKMMTVNVGPNLRKKENHLRKCLGLFGSVFNFFFIFKKLFLKIVFIIYF